MPENAILLVDDDLTLRDVISSMITYFGYELLVAATGSEAEAVYQEHSADIRVALLDFKLPDIDGVALISQLRQIDPDCQFVITTGFSADRVTAAQGDLPITAILQKPYKMAELKNLLDSCFESVQT